MMNQKILVSTLCAIACTCAQAETPAASSKTVVVATDKQSASAMSNELQVAIRKEIETTMRKEMEAIRKDMKTVARQEIDSTIAYIEPMKIFDTKEIQASIKNIEKAMEDKKKELIAVEKKGMEERAAFERMAAALDDRGREERIERLAKLEAEYKSKGQAAQIFAEREQEKLRMEGLKKMQDAVNDIASNDGYTMILAGGVVYGKRPNDITEKVVSRMNEIYVAKNKDGAQKESTVVAQSTKDKKTTAA